VTGAVIANVVPQTQHALVKLCKEYFSCDPYVVGQPGVDLGIKVKLDRPEEVGADRLVNAVAVLEKYDYPAIVIDFGTATTLDVIDKDGAYVGGVIAPGVNLSLEALVEAAAKLPRINIQKPEKVIGTRTVEAMQSGLYWGYVSLIEGLVERIEKEYGQKMQLIATGGLSTLFGADVKNLKVIDKELTINGLNLIYLKQNEQKTKRSANS
jgi:type III pantothenate kinase